MIRSWDRITVRWDWRSNYELFHELPIDKLNCLIRIFDDNSIGIPDIVKNIGSLRQYAILALPTVILTAINDDIYIDSAFFDWVDQLSLSFSPSSSEATRFSRKRISPATSVHTLSRLFR